MADFRLSEAELKQDPEEVFNLLDKLGEGSYGAVYKAMHKATGNIVALKIVPVENDLEDIVKEINVMNGCDSAFIVRYYGSYFKNDNLWMFIEFCGAGSVADLMKLCKCTMTEAEIAVIVKGALEGLKYLHERKKIHRDIKAGNILLNHKGEAKLADFGVAGQLSDTVAKRNTLIGSPYWMACEVLTEAGYDCSADIWSLGITSIEMADGRPPLYNVHPMRAIFIIPSRPPPTLENPAEYSEAFNQFIARCLVKKPENRPSAAELLNDPFIQSTGGPSILVEKVQKAVDLIAQGALSREDDEEEEEDGSEDGNDMSSATVKSRISMKKQDDTEIDGSLTANFSTMMVNDSSPSTMKAVESNSTYKPAFMKMLKKEDGTVKPAKPVPAQQTEPIPQANDNIEELNEMLRALEKNMEKEISQLKQRYDQKRSPIIQAIKSKKGTALP